MRNVHTPSCPRSYSCACMCAYARDFCEPSRRTRVRHRPDRGHTAAIAPAGTVHSATRDSFSCFSTWPGGVEPVQEGPETPSREGGGHGREQRHLQVTVGSGCLVHGAPLPSVLFLIVHEVARDGAAAGVHGGLPQQDQGRVSDLTERQIIGRT